MRLFPEITVRRNIWDPDKSLFNCPDGTVDLRTREILPHDPRNLITRIARVSPKFDYDDSRWVNELPTWFGSNPSDIEYIQKLLGMFLTGEIRDHCVAMWLGLGGSGKSRAPEIMLYIMGDYAQVATDTAFVDVKYQAHSEQIARMDGKRLVIINEVEGNLNLQRVKTISAGEMLSASLKGKDSFEFSPEAKLWFIGNEPPASKSSGHELQRRFHVFDFVNQIKAREENMRDILEREARSILGWVVDGAVKYYKDGKLVKSQHVIESTRRYFSDADILEQWIEDHCIVNPETFFQVKALFENFDFWADGSGVRYKPDIGRFSQRLKAKGYMPDRRTVERGKQAVRVIIGLRLRSEDGLPFRGVGPEADRF